MAPALLHIFLHCHLVFNSSRLRRAALTWELLVGYYWETTMNAMSAAAYHNIILVRYPLLWYTALLKGFYFLLTNAFFVIMALNCDLSLN